MVSDLVSSFPKKASHEQEVKSLGATKAEESQEGRTEK
jgi:hypothetical protein